jgi:hypothetical protein
MLAVHDAQARATIASKMAASEGAVVIALIRRGGWRSGPEEFITSSVPPN